MAITKKQFVCANCGAVSQKWQGKCGQCGEWNSLQEQAVYSSKSSSAAGFSGKIDVQKLSVIKQSSSQRLDSGFGEVNSVLGGGLVSGSLVLLGGDPGIGKSTLALQLAVNIENSGKKVLYVSGEESGQQIKMRAARLQNSADISILTETNFEAVAAAVNGYSPDVVIIDSIQTLNSSEVNGVVGGVSQLSFVTNGLMRIAKSLGSATIVIGHVTKEGILAGPKTIEHMVDVVLYLEGDRLGNLRFLRSVKNRFGSVGEIGVFDMRQEGLAEVANPSAMFLEHSGKNLVGSSTTAILEGNKVLLLEVQALTSTSNFGYPKRATSGYDSGRLQLILAILQKVLKVNLSNQDVYINVAGGFKIDERASDIPVALAVLSSYYGQALPEQTLAFGEIGLLGELRQVSQSDKRVKEGKKLGFKNFISAKEFSSVQQLAKFFKK